MFLNILKINILIVFLFKAVQEDETNESEGEDDTDEYQSDEEESPKRKLFRKEPERLQPEQKRSDSSVSLLLKSGSESEDSDEENSDARVEDSPKWKPSRKEPERLQPERNKRSDCSVSLLLILCHLCSCYEIVPTVTIRVFAKSPPLWALPYLLSKKSSRRVPITVIIIMYRWRC